MVASEQLLVRLLMDARQYKQEARGAAAATGAVAGSAKGAATQTAFMNRQLGATGITMRTAIVGGSLVAGAAIVGFAKESAQAASNLQESMNAVNVVFGDAADGIHAIGEEAADSFGLSQRAFNEFAVRFSAFAEQIAERDGRSVVEVVEEMTGRIADFASVHNLSLERAAEVAQSTLAGETEVFRRFGGDVSAASVETKLLEEGIVGVGEAASEQDKILGRYMLFMEQTAKTAGDFKNTQDDLANATRTLSANFEEFQARAGASLTPALAEAAAQGIQLFDILDPDIDLGWTQRLSAGFQLIHGEGSEAVKTYIEQKEALNDLERAADDTKISIDEVGGASGSSAGDFEDLASATYEARDAALLARTDIGKLDGVIRESGGAWDDVVTSMEDYETMLARLTDPVFKAIDDQRRLEDATQAYLDTAADPQASVEDLEQAMLDLVQAQIVAGESAAALPADMQSAADSIDAVGRQAQISDEHLRLLRERILSFDGLEANSTVRINVVGGERITGGNINTDISLRHSGGPGVAGERYLIRPDEEIFVPSGNGEFLLNDQVINALKGLSGGRSTTNNFNIPIQSSGDPNTDAQLVGAVHSVLRRMETL